MANMQNVEKNRSEKSSNRSGGNFKGDSQRQNQNQQGQRQSQGGQQNEDQDQQSGQTGGMGAKFPMGAIGTAVTSELVTKFATPVVEDIMNSLSDRFGRESIENILKTFNLPEDFDLKALVDWDPIKNKITKNPVASAAVAAIGVGTLYLAREALAGRGIGKDLFNKVNPVKKSKGGNKSSSRKTVAAKRSKSR